jgi:hypothetical protein
MRVSNWKSDFSFDFYDLNYVSHKPKFYDLSQKIQILAGSTGNPYPENNFEDDFDN